MGGTPSSTKTTQLNETLNQTTTSVMANASTSASGSVIADQTLVIAGVSGSTISGINMNQAATVNISALQDVNVNSKMQADLVTALLSKLEQESSSGFPELTGSSTDTTVQNTVKNIVASNLSVSAMASLSATVAAKQTVAITGVDSSVIDTINLNQKADAVGNLINSMSSELSSALLSNTSVSSDTSLKSKNFLVQGLDSIGTGFKGVADSVGDTLQNMTSLSPMTLIVILIAIIISGYVGYTMIMRRPVSGGHGSPAGMQTSDSSPYVVSN